MCTATSYLSLGLVGGFGIWDCPKRNFFRRCPMPRITAAARVPKLVNKYSTPDWWWDGSTAKVKDWRRWD